MIHQTWTCAHCGRENEVGHVWCEGCSTMRDDAPVTGRKESLYVAARVKSAPAHWSAEANKRNQGANELRPASTGKPAR